MLLWNTLTVTLGANWLHKDPQPAVMNHSALHVLNFEEHTPFKVALNPVWVHPSRSKMVRFLSTSQVYAMREIHTVERMPSNGAPRQFSGSSYCT